MKIAVINEVSAAHRNADIVNALDGRGFEILNIGMKSPDEDNKIFYTHTGLLTGLVLNLGIADFVVGGCGTGQGYLDSAMQYPGVFCGHILNSMDSWLFAQINSGNSVSLALNQGYGWAAEVNLRFIFDRLFEVEHGSGYPKNRAEPQEKMRKMLEKVSESTHKSLAEIITDLDDEVMEPALSYPGILELLDIENIEDEQIRTALIQRSNRYS